MFIIYKLLLTGTDQNGSVLEITQTTKRNVGTKLRSRPAHQNNVEIYFTKMASKSGGKYGIRDACSTANIFIHFHPFYLLRNKGSRPIREIFGQAD